MKTLLLLVLFTAYSSSQLTSDVPLFVWSGEARYLSVRNVGLSTALTPSDVESLLASIVQGTTAPTVFSTVMRSMNPEALVIFLEPQLRLDQVVAASSHLSHLKKLMQSSNSFYSPYVDLFDTLDYALVNAAELTDEKGASVIYAGKGDTLLPTLKRRVPKVSAVALKNLQSTLRDSSVFTNHITDLIIVHLEKTDNVLNKFEQTNEMINSVATFINQQTSNYVAVYTSLAYEHRADNSLPFASETTQKRSGLDMMANAEYQEILQSSNITNGTQPSWFQQYFPGYFWEVALLFVMVVPWIITGFVQLASVQVPDNFVVKVKKS